MQPIGVCLFDDEQVARDGWASIAGDEPFRVSSHADLGNSAIWVTNLPFFAYRKHNLWKTRNIFDAQFFRTSLKMLSAEIGVESNHMAASSILSDILNRTAVLAKERLAIPIEDATYRFNTLIQDYYLPASIRSIPEGDTASVIIDAGNHSFQQNQAMSGTSAPRGSSIHSFYMPRPSYCRWLLRQNYPIGREWRAYDFGGIVTLGVQDGQTIRGTQGAVEELNKLDQSGRAMVCRVNIPSQEKRYADYSRFGAGAALPRQWATLPEVVELAKYSKIEIIEAYTAEAGKIEVDKRIEDLFNDMSDDISISKGLLMENVIFALNSGPKKEYSPMASAYMRAYDRMACSKAAHKLSDEGFVIGSYGSGRVMVYVRPSQVQVISDIAHSTGLIPPFSYLRQRHGSN